MSIRDLIQHRRAIALILAPLVGVMVVLRAYLHLIDPNTDLIVAGHEVHHLFSGILLVLAAAFPLALSVAGPAARDALLVVLGLGAGMVADEFVYLIVTPGTNAAYLTRPSWLGAIAMGLGAVAYVLLVATSPPRSRP